MSYARAIVPKTHLRQRRRYATTKAVARHHEMMQLRGRITASPVSAPPWHPRVWIRSDHRHAPLVAAAAAERVMNRAELLVLSDKTDSDVVPIGLLSRLGIVAVPVQGQRVQLKGTSRDLAHIANRVLHGRRNRLLTSGQLIAAYRGRHPNGKRVRPTESVLEAAVDFMFDHFGIDLSDLYGGKPVRP